MIAIPRNPRPTVNGPVIHPGLTQLSAQDLLTSLVGAAIEVAEQNVSECYGGVSQYPPQTVTKTLQRYPEGEAWRDCASPSLCRLVDTLRAISADIPKPFLDPSAAQVSEPKTVTADLTDDALLATHHRSTGDKP